MEEGIQKALKDELERGSRGGEGIHHIRDSQSVVFGPGALASPRNLLEMQTLSPSHTYRIRNAEAGPTICSTSPPGDERGGQSIRTRRQKCSHM